MFFMYLASVGASNINTLFLLHKPLKWGPKKIGIYQSIAELAQGITLLFLLPSSSLVAISTPDSMIVLIGIAISSVLYLASGFAQSTWEMFLGRQMHVFAYTMHDGELI